MEVGGETGQVQESLGTEVNGLRCLSHWALSPASHPPTPHHKQPSPPHLAVLSNCPNPFPITLTNDRVIL